MQQGKRLIDFYLLEEYKYTHNYMSNNYISISYVYQISKIINIVIIQNEDTINLFRRE